MRKECTLYVKLQIKIIIIYIKEELYFYKETYLRKFIKNIKVDVKLTTNVLILYYIIFFLCKRLSRTNSCGFFCDKQKKSRELVRAGTGVTARLDTFGVTFHFFFPILFYSAYGVLVFFL